MAKKLEKGPQGLGLGLGLGFDIKHGMGQEYENLAFFCGSGGPGLRLFGRLPHGGRGVNLGFYCIW